MPRPRCRLTPMARAQRRRCRRRDSRASSAARGGGEPCRPVRDDLRGERPCGRLCRHGQAGRAHHIGRDERPCWAWLCRRQKPRDGNRERAGACWRRLRCALATTRGALDATRDASIVAGIAPTGLSAAGPGCDRRRHPQAFANEKTGGSIAFGSGGTSYTVTAWEDGSGAADLLFLNGTGVSNSGSLFIAGGNVRRCPRCSREAIAGGGVLVYAGKSLHTGQRKSGFRLTADFSNAASARSRHQAQAATSPRV